MPITEEQLEQSLNFLIANALSDALTLGLSDGLGAAVIHTNSSIPRKLKLSIANNLPVEVQIVGQPGPASDTNYHFHIQFVDNPCFWCSPPPTLTTPNWLMKALGDGEFITDIYLLSTETITLKPASSKGNTTGVQIEYVNATLKTVDVEVLQVAVTVGQNVVALINPNPQKVTGTETVNLSTFTDAGAPSPLIATLVQPRTILNDGTTNSQLLLRLVNTSPEPVTFAPPPVANGPTPTAVQLSVDLNEAAAWALCKSDEAGSIVVPRPANWKGDPAGVIGTGRKTWLFRPDYSLTTQIAPNSALEFLISGVRTTLPPGFTNLYVTLQEFPNYGTQTAVAQIEKSPLVYNSGLNSGLLSSGTTGANQALTLNGNTTADLLLVNQSGAGKSAHFKGGVGVTIENNLVVQKTTTLRGDLTVGSDASRSKLTVYSSPLVIDAGDKGVKITGNSLTFGAGTQSLVIDKTNGLSVTGPLSVSNGLKMDQANAVIQRGDGNITCNDLGLYSNAPGNWIRFVTNGSPIKFFTDGGNGTNPALTINPERTLDVSSDPSAVLRISTHSYTGFPDFNNNAEICNDITTSYGKALMILGNSSRNFGNGPRWVQVWDNLEVKNDLFIYGRVWFGADGGLWRYLENNGGDNKWAYWIYGTPAPSDLRFKREVQPVSSALDKVRSLRGVTFSWNEDALQHFTRDIETTLSAGPNATESENQKVRQAERDKRRNHLSATQVGIVAQEVETVLPEAVTTDADGYKSVRYDNLIPLLIEAIKEQDQLTARQQAEIEGLKLALGIGESPDAPERVTTRNHEKQPFTRGTTHAR